MTLIKEYEWDANDALGDTINEKIESIYLFFLNIMAVFSFEAIVADLDLMDILSSASFFDHHFDLDVSDPIYVGKFKFRPWRFYRSERLNREIILCDSNGDYVLIKVINL